MYGNRGGVFTSSGYPSLPTRPLTGLSWSGLFGPFSPLHSTPLPSTPLSTPLQATSVHSRPLLFHFRSQNMVHERPEPAQIIANNSVCSLSPFLLVFSCHFVFCLILFNFMPNLVPVCAPPGPSGAPLSVPGRAKKSTVYTAPTLHFCSRITRPFRRVKMEATRCHNVVQM